MSYINSEDRAKKRQQFILLYSFTILVLVGIGYALNASRPATVAPVQKYIQPTSIIEADKGTDTVSQALQLRVEALQQELNEKEKKISQLQNQPKTPLTVKTIVKTVPATASESEELKFLRWALSSQSGDFEKLKRENARLKAQLNDLQRR